MLTRTSRAQRVCVRVSRACPLRPQGLYSASAGTHPAGSVVGAAGHNAAAVVARDMGVQPWWPTA